MASATTGRRRTPLRAARGWTAPVVAVTTVLALVGCSPSGADPAPLAPAPSTRSAVPVPVASASPAMTPSATPDPSPSSTPRRVSPSPTPQPNLTSSAATPGPLIVIDPGHSGRSIRSTDARTGLRDIDYPNYPEIYEMFDVSVCVAQGLRRDGYRVTLTKQHALDSVGLAARARTATKAKAALAISVHDDHSQTAAFQATYSQRGVTHGGRYHAMYRGTGSHRTVFADAAVARASEKAAATLARLRSSVQSRTVSVRENVFTGRPPLEPGNLALVQLLAGVPWVYNEAGARTGGSTTQAMSIGGERAYALGLLTGVEGAVPLPDGPLKQPSAGATGLRACLVSQVQPGTGAPTRPRRYLPAGW